MNKCKICNNLIKEIISFGKMPIANGFLADIKKKEYFFHLWLGFCSKCYMVQLGDTVKPQKLFNKNYQFISSTSTSMEKYFKNYADNLIKFIKNRKNPFIVELGCNDGIMLKHIAKKNIKHLGVEPASNVAKLANKNGVKTFIKFFNEKNAREILKKYGPADVICGSSVFCHIENLNSVIQGVKILLKKDGMLMFEDPYIYDIIKKTSFDQIYDEHVFYFSGLSVQYLANKHNMQLVKMEHQEIHGGCMRYILKIGSNNKINKSVIKFTNLENKLNLHLISGYNKFKFKVDRICKDLKNTLFSLKRKNKIIVGYAATSKSTTLLNYANIDSDLIKYIVDTTPTKINKYSPGVHIPIKAYSDFKSNYPDYSVLFAWNHKKEILTKEKVYKKSGGKFITYFPKVSII